jgi:hypothetical protein
MAPLEKGVQQKIGLFCDAHSVNWHWRKLANTPYVAPIVHLPIGLATYDDAKSISDIGIGIETKEPRHPQGDRRDSG